VVSPPSSSPVVVVLLSVLCVEVELVAAVSVVVGEVNEEDNDPLGECGGVMTSDAVLLLKPLILRFSKFLRLGSGGVGVWGAGTGGGPPPSGICGAESVRVIS